VLSSHLSLDTHGSCGADSPGVPRPSGGVTSMAGTAPGQAHGRRRSRRNYPLAYCAVVPRRGGKGDIVRHPSLPVLLGTVVVVLGCSAALTLPVSAKATPAGAASAASRGTADTTGAMVLAADDPTAADYKPTFTGNGYLGLRVPPVGQGYASGADPTSSQLAGFYAQAAGGVQQRATIPTWSTLIFSDGGIPFSLSAGRVSGWRQSLDLRTGVVTTSADWTAPNGHSTRLRYQLFTDRADADIGVVRLTLTPSWTGPATVTDAIDGTPATLSSAAGQGWRGATGLAGSDWVEVRAEDTGITASLASTLEVGTVPPGTTKAATPAPGITGPESVGQQVTLHMLPGRPVVVTKFVAVRTGPAAAPPSASLARSVVAAHTGFGRLLAANDAAWSSLWSGRIDVLGDPALATDVNASEFYLWSSTRPHSDWSISPGGLSSGGYDGHIFWDAETWMYPALLAQHPDLALGMDRYRLQRLGAARQHATATGYGGARFPWESALDGTEQIPPPATVFTEGLYEQHVTADIALAQWQYYLASGDRQWLARRGWPVISAAAAFWASRATLAGGTYHIDGVTGPDEENQDVADEAYTVAAARGTLVDADAAARVLGIVPPPQWRTVAEGLVKPTLTSSGAVAEFDGYDGQMVKQADVTLLQYPWATPLPAGTEQADIDYYAPRTDPSGPSMSDALNAIDTAALGASGCSAGVFTEESVSPYIRDVFRQWSETPGGGTLTFMTGIGGFLQEFLYGYSGLRWSTTGVPLDPILSAPLQGVVLHDLKWHGRTFTVAIGRRSTTVDLISGASLPVLTPSGHHTLTSGHPLVIPTRRSDVVSSNNLLRCQAANATSSTPSGPALAAVDGSPATAWQPAGMPAELTVPLRGGIRTIASATVRWGQAWPPPGGLDTAPLPAPVTTLRAASYSVAVKVGGTWRTVASVSGTIDATSSTATVDKVGFPPVRASAVALRLSTSATATPPVVDELSAGP
jgi:trehalose/maltose hydrolase-like predicted phosphorylase